MGVGISVGYLANSFDLLNVRDLDLIAQAGSLCSRLMVGVHSDDFVEQVHGRRPVVPLVERIALVRRVRGVSEAVLHDDDVQLELVTICFTVAPSPPVRHSGPAMVLAPRRDTTSSALREALRSYAGGGRYRRQDVA